MKQERLFEVAQQPPKAQKPPRDPIEEMVGALTDPVIVFPGGGWEETIPERLKAELPLRRLAHIHMCLERKAAWDEACDLEALIYLYPASLVAPMSEQWTRLPLLGDDVLWRPLPAEHSPGAAEQL